MKEPKLKIGVAIVILAWAFFSTSYFISKKITHETTVATMIFFRSAVGTLMVLPFMLKDFRKSFKPSKPNIVFVRAMSALVNISFIYIAVRSISLVDATLLTNSAPLFVPIFSAIALKKKMDLKIWISVLIGFAGVILILHPDRAILNWGALFALGSGIATAISIITAHLARNEKFHTVLFYTFLLGLIASLPFTYYDWEVTPSLILPLIMLGVFGALGQWGLFKALQYASASHIAPFGYTSVIFSAIFDLIFFHVFPGALSLVGIVLVVVSGIIILMASEKKNGRT